MKHPAKYSDALLPVFADMLSGVSSVLDPFAGTGKIFLLHKYLPGLRIYAIEIEPEWVIREPGSMIGNALHLPFADHSIGALCTSVTYGNRLADHHKARDNSTRHSYTHDLGRALHPDNSGAMQWGEAYRQFHIAAWKEARRVLVPRAKLILNIKDHIRQGKRILVSDWHRDAILALGFKLTREARVNTPSLRYGANASARIDYESIFLFTRG